MTELTDKTPSDERRDTSHPSDCLGRCPRFLKPWYCCTGCGKSRRAFRDAAPPEVQKLWTEPTGFWDPARGCRLDRGQRPPECGAYDCGDQVFVMASARTPEGSPILVRELDRDDDDELAFLDKAREIWRELHERGILAKGVAWTAGTEWSGLTPLTGEPEPRATGHESLSSWDRAFRHIDGPTVFILQGLMGSGKSGWARKFVARHRRALVVSGDGFRSMLPGQYEYRVELDDLITESMCATMRQALKAGYDVVVDVGNITKERRAPWLAIAKEREARTVAVVLPRMHKDWHVSRRRADPHGTSDPGAIYDREKAALEPVESSGESYDDVIFVPAQEVSARKILILSASPVRDKHIDNLIAEKLRALGHEVEVSPCQRGGREKVLQFKPDICLVPPIRNPNSRDFVAELKRFGCAVVTRHTEPSCSWQDWKKMPPQSRTEILGAFPYLVDLELVWSQDEADILNRRGVPFKAVAVGAIGLDIYFDEQLKARLTHRPEFCTKYKLDIEKPTLLISSPWGFADSSPDLGTDEILAAQRDAAGRDRHLAMIRAIVPLLKGTWNLLMTVHPGVGAAPYQTLAKELGIPIDAENPMLDLLPNCDALIHAGSTAAVSAHLLDIPAYQYGDVNAEGSASWWGVGESAISRVSPMAKSPEDLAEMIRVWFKGSNANPATITELEEGRYGRIDGHGTDRAVALITQLMGRFAYNWPRSPHDYRQLTVQRAEGDFLKKAVCGVCHQTFVFWTEEYLAQVAKTVGIDPAKLRPKGSICCPFCAARMFQA
jgi:predicted kinase